MSPEQIRQKAAWPKGFVPSPHPNHAEGGMLFPKHHIDDIKKQEERDLTRFDLDFDLPQHFLPEFPPPIYLTTRTDLGDVSQGQVVEHGAGIVLLVQGESKHADKIQSLIDRKVKFVACRNTLRDKSIAEDRFLPGVQVTASGAVEVLRKQQEGFSYFKR